MYKIYPYYGFGTNKQVFFKGRVVFDNHLETWQQKSGWFNKFITFYKRFSVKPAVNLSVTVSHDGITQTVTTNEYGIFTAVFDPRDATDDQWLVAQASISLDDKVVIANLTSVNDVANNSFGIISDIDDTVLVSNATNKIRLIYNTIFKKTSDRLAFDGAADWYNQLVCGPKNNDSNPIFYVSSSHWNLYDLLMLFLDNNKFPRGPLLLKRINSIKQALLTVGNHDHKRQKIIEIIDTFPDLAFVLIGDSGQRDAAIYTTIAINYPNRVKAIFIRDVTNYPDPLVEAARKLLPSDLPLMVFKNTTDAVKTSHSLGLIKV